MKSKMFAVMKNAILGVVLGIVCWMAHGMEARALTLTLEFDATTQEVIVAGVPASNDDYFYNVCGNLKFGDERVESFCYGLPGAPYHIPDRQAYVFSYADKEFILPGSGTYVMTAWIETIDNTTGTDLGKSQWTSIEFYYQKKDESTNWGPGLPETMVEDWEIANLQGKSEDMVVSGGGEAYPYTWTINGMDIYSVPAEDVNVDLEILSMDARFDAYIPGNEITNIQLDIAHSGDFGFTAKLDYTLGAEHAGRYANLFYILETGKYEFVQSCQIDANGVATFSLNHASSYIIVIRDEAYTGDTIIEATEESTTTPEVSDGVTEESVDASSLENATLTSPDEGNKDKGNKAGVGTSLFDNKTKKVWGIIGVVIVILAIISAVTVCFVKKKKEQ